MRALFVCVQNAGRSQMAEALYKRAGGEGRSAGTSPAERVHPEVVEVMRELGIDLADRKPHGLETADAEWADVVVTMGCGDACPVLPGKLYIDWNLEDPAGKPIDAVRAIRDEIDERIQGLLGDMEKAGSPMQAPSRAAGRAASRSA
jgi:arsenate reductase (thioredoxin)